ncbi:MAG: anti-sigma factor [Nakamurella sp.]
MFTLTRSECKKIAGILQAYLDGEAGPAAARRVAEHLDVCRKCGLDANTYLAIRSALAARNQAPAEDGAIDRLRHFAEQLAEPQQ